ncbi:MULTISPECIES: hypothetical protein [Streptomyces]|jgi:hypothetical protein|uniref:Uncharacterized protein n=2 Tax=Streptomyces TaxID=1883 RepID=A0AB39NMI9_9ACTN|nr:MULTISPECIES: hypothetical protein [Actinomycetes]MCI4142374.1 hypothetical protein [Streptomyces sp. MMS20-AI2-20]GGQ02567.1 hypothetical protein GCM10010233_18680 [Streptomyces gancidicus]
MADQTPAEPPVCRIGATLPDQERARRVFVGRPGLAPTVGQQRGKDQGAR